MKKKLLVATEIKNIEGLYKKLSKTFEIIYYPYIETSDLINIDEDIYAIFTNPNNLKIYFGHDVLKKFKFLKTFATASTGTTHIDKVYLKKSEIELISITKSVSVLERITSTAEHAFLLTLSALRHYDKATSSVKKGIWDYSPFIGRQMNSLKIGVIGYGRLGKMYSKFCNAFEAEVLCYDPFKKNAVLADGYQHSNIANIFETCDVVSLHIHATPENLKLIGGQLLEKSNPNLILINTSRGEIIDEKSLFIKIRQCPNFKYYTDVLTDEHKGLSQSDLFKSKAFGNQVFITPHCGGMTSDARAIAYHHAADLLIKAY